MNTPEYQTTRIWKKTLRTLRFIHAITGESIVAIMDRLAENELATLEREQKSERKRQSRHGDGEA